MFELVLGTGNAHKVIELREMLPRTLRLLSLADFERPLEVEEVGETFAENARLKATEQAKHWEAARVYCRRGTQACTATTKPITAGYCKS